MGRETQAGRDRLLETDVAEVGVGDVADEDPSDLENALPLVGSPNGAAACVIDLPTEGVSRSACRRGERRSSVPVSTSRPCRRNARCESMTMKLGMDRGSRRGTTHLAFTLKNR